MLVGDRDRVGVGVSPSKTFYSLSLKYLEELRLVLSNCVESASLGGVWVGMGH